MPCSGLWPKKFKFYLDGQKFTIETDHNPLVWLRSNTRSNPRLMRLSLELQPFQYDGSSQAGQKTQNSDVLSRSDSRTEII
ncbi:retrovirus-related Pol polyprotein from transposon 297 [Caerostris extrusa]|uniref:Retrovirus-related Pol polyprotein from transposon 297 n=1 Tax=Caerostris extrusa TaxID=172846 RepID=A0AAV4UQJ9_CAEEX|nr:retrovirus-related Pol polyprotein from transposon 297 [Caerostris extrusa]